MEELIFEKNGKTWRKFHNITKVVFPIETKDIWIYNKCGCGKELPLDPLTGFMPYHECTKLNEPNKLIKELEKINE